jgi:hypothetical protein
MVRNNVFCVFFLLIAKLSGDFYPTLVGTKVFFMFYAAIGVSLLAAALGYFSASVSQAIANSNDSAAKRFKKCGCSDKTVQWFVKQRIWIYIGGTYVLLLLLGAVLFGFAVPFQNPEYLNGMYFTC